MSQPLQRARLPLLLATAVALVVTLGWLARGWLNAADSELALFPPEPCDLSTGPCQARHDDSWLRFAIEAERLAPHQVLPLHVALSDSDVESVVVDFQGLEMFMGHNRFELNRQSDGSFRGEAQLPACTTGAMRWRARVLVTRHGTITGSWFDFTAEEG